MDWAKDLLPYLGTVPMWGVFAMVLVALVQVWPKLKQIDVAERKDKRDSDVARIKELKADVQRCRDECDAQERRLMAEIDTLKRKINNEAWQRVQSEISLVNTLLDIVPADQLRTILAALKARQLTLPAYVGGPVDDTQEGAVEDGDKSERA